MARSVNGFLGTYLDLAALKAARHPASYAGCSANVGTDPVYTKAWCDGEGWYLLGKPQTVAASYFGIRAGTADMTSAMTVAANASFELGKVVELPPGDINISGEIVVTSAQQKIYQTADGPFTATLPVGFVGYGGNMTTLVQNTSGIRHMYYRPTNSVIARAKFADFRLRHASPSYTNINQAGIQLGGVAGQDIVVDSVSFSSVVGEGLYSVVRVDDCTGLYVTGSGQNGRFKYYVEGGYNADQYKFYDFNMSYDAPQNIVCTNTSGTNTLSGISTTIIPYLAVGMSVTGAGIPVNTTITAVGTTSVTLSANTTSAVTLFHTHLGTLLSLLSTNGSTYSGSGFATVANNANYFNRTRSSNPNSIIFDNVLFNRAEGLIEDYGSSYNVAIRDVYMERPRKVASFLGAGLKGFNIERVFLSQPETIRDPYITIASAIPQGRIQDIVTDGTLNTSIAVAALNVTSTSEFGPLVVENVPGAVRTGAGADVSASARKVVVGSSENGTAIWNYDTASGDANFDALGIDTIEVTISGSGRTLIGPNSVQVPQYRKLRVIFSVNSAGATFTLGAKYKKADGTNWGTITAGSVGQRAWLEFTSMGNGTYISAQQTLGWA